MNNKISTIRLLLGQKPLEDSISDNIRTILFTSPAECPFRPRFGLGIERLLDTNIDNLDLAFEVASKISDYEKRIKVKQVVSVELTPGHRQVKIIYEILKTNKLTQIIIN